jgi:tRNA nucleotidyltransferase/poly(A) polymerase
MTRKASPAHARAAALAIVRRLRKHDHNAYFAGGCVRDELLGLSPTDYDIATDATPDRIRSLFKRTAEVGAAFGVILVTLGREEGLAEQATVEVATFRSEGTYSDRRRPDSVSFSDAKADALRRDFTINALFIDPLTPESEPAHVIDYVGGRADLRARVLRAVGEPDARLAEDHLRALRAVRFAARLDFELDPATAAAVHRHTRELAGVSRERIGDEIRRMLAHPSRARAVALLESLGLDAPVLTESPTASPSHPLTPSPSHPPLLSGPASPHNHPHSLYPRHLADWALDRGLTLEKPTIDAVLKRWRAALCLSNEERAGLAAILRNLALLEQGWLSLPTAQQKRAVCAGGVWFEHALDQLEARKPQLAAAARARISELAATSSGLCPEPILTGDHLLEMGLTSGPRYKVILDRVYDAQLEDRVTTIEQARELARTLRV